MPEQTPAIQEQTVSPEKVVDSNQYRAVHGRFLLDGEALNPDKKDLAPVTKESLGSFESHSYNVFSSASTNERKQTALVNKDQLGEAINVWSEKTTTVLNQDFANLKGFTQEKAQRFNQLITKLSGSAPGHVTVEQVRSLYNKYFIGETKGSNVKQFVSDVLTAFDNDLPTVEQNLDCVEWVAKIFGNQSSEMIRELVTAETMLRKQPDKLIEELNKAPEQGKPSRINEINSIEEGLLRFIWQGKDQSVTTVPTEKTVVDDSTKPPKEIEKNENDALKKRYFMHKDKFREDILNDKITVEDLNKELKQLGLDEKNEGQLKELREDEEKRSQFARELVVANEKYELKTILMTKVVNQEIYKLSDHERTFFELYDQINIKIRDNDQKGAEEIKQKLKKLIEENHIDSNALVKKINEKAKEKEPEINATVERAIQAFEKQIDIWEGMTVKEEPEEKPTTTDESASATVTASHSAEASRDKPADEKKKKKEGLLAKLSRRFKKGFKQGVDKAKTEAK